MVTQWSPELTLNHDLLDPQHVTLFRLLEDATAAVDGPPADLLGAVARFGEALVVHVAEEARVMEESHYPDRVRHGASHDLLVADVLGVLSELASSGPSPRLVTVVSTHLPEWLRYHTRVNDGPLGAWLARRGPNPTPIEGRRRRATPRKPS